MPQHLIEDFFVYPSRSKRRIDRNLQPLVDDILLLIMNYLTILDKRSLALTSMFFNLLIKRHKGWKLGALPSRRTTSLKPPLSTFFNEVARSNSNNDNNLGSLVLYYRAEDSRGALAQFFFESMAKKPSFFSRIFSSEKDITSNNTHEGWGGLEKRLEIPLNKIIKRLTTKNITEVLALFSTDARPLGINLHTYEIIFQFIDSTNIAHFINPSSGQLISPLRQWPDIYINLYYANKSVAYMINAFLMNCFGEKSSSIRLNYNPHGQEEYVVSLHVREINITEQSPDIECDKLRKMFGLLLSEDAQKQTLDLMVKLLYGSVVAFPPSSCVLI